MLCDVLGLDERPRLDEVRLRNAVDGFRSELAQHNAAAVQQPAAVTLHSSTEKIEEGLAKWALSAWKTTFEEYSALAVKDNLQSLAGPVAKVTRAKRVASQIQNAVIRNPIRDLGAIEKALETDGIEACGARLRELGSELGTLLGELEREQAAMPPRVQKMLERAASEDGFPLEALTEEMLILLREAGVLGQFVVRRS